MSLFLEFIQILWDAGNKTGLEIKEIYWARRTKKLYGSERPSKCSGWALRRKSWASRRKGRTGRMEQCGELEEQTQEEGWSQNAVSSQA